MKHKEIEDQLIGRLAGELVGRSQTTALKSVLFAFLKRHCKSPEELADLNRLFYQTYHDALSKSIQQIPSDYYQEEIGNMLTPELHAAFSAARH